MEIKKNEVSKIASNIELYPEALDSHYDVADYKKIPFGGIASLGTSFESVSAAFQYITSGGKATSGLYKVVVPNGGSLASFNKRSGYLGSVLKENGAVGGGQAILNPLVMNPTSVFMAVALASITQKLDSIQLLQEEMMNFLIQKERSELKGDLNFLQDTLNNYQFNWNNEKYKNNHHIKVLDIKQNSERKIDFYKELISTQLKKKKLFSSDQDVNKDLAKIQNDLKDFQLSLYLFSFSSFLEVMLLENFESKYLNSIATKIEKHLIQYKNIYTQTYEKIEHNARNSVESHILNGLASFNKLSGETLAKVPVISKTKLDETLIESSDKLKSFNKNRTTEKMQVLIDKQAASVRPFIDNVKMVDKLFNNNLEIVFDQENLYIKALS